MTVPRTFRPGVYGPLPTFFDENEEIDYEAYKAHLLHLAKLGIVPVVGGSLGEAVHLSREDRMSLLTFVRKTLDEAGLQDRPIVAGVGGISLRETIALARDAATAGADAGMVILPAYYAASLGSDMTQIVQYYVDVCAASPIPILLYNFPANAGGLDMPSAVIEEVMRKAPNLCGVKLTCPGSVGKLVRLSGALSDGSVNAVRSFPFLVLDGLIADLIPWCATGGHGTVSGIPNFAPRATMKLWNYTQNPNPTAAETKEAWRLQSILSNADVAAVPSGVRGMKYVLNKTRGYGITPRRPLLPLDECTGEVFYTALKQLLDIEAELELADTD